MSDKKGFLSSIRLMTSSDVDEVLEIERNSHLEPWSRRSFLEEFEKEHSRILVARVFEMPCIEASSLQRVTAEAQLLSSGHVAGHICFWLVADEAQILNLAVSPTWRRRGLGRMLMLCALSCAVERGACIATLEARMSNHAALRLYGSLGFGQVGCRPDYYGGHKEPAILMELSLNDGWAKAHHDEIETLNCKGLLL